MFKSILKSVTKLFIFFILINLLSLSKINAQSVEIIESTSNFIPGDEVDFSLSSSGIDLDKSDISWNIDNKNIISGFGEKNIKIIIPKEEAILNALITTVKGEKYNASFRLYTKGVILYFEATDSYVPSWYAGKKMLVKGGTARIYAFPNITNKSEKIKDSDINFTWEINGEVNKKSSGYGKNYLDITALEIVKQVMDINIVKTEVLLYPKSGNTKRVLFGTNKFSTNDFIISAEPYFFSLDKKYNFYWEVGGRAEKGFNEKGFKLSKAGTFANIKVKVEHVKKIFQEAQSELTATF